MVNLYIENKKFEVEQMEKIRQAREWRMINAANAGENGRGLLTSLGEWVNGVRQRTVDAAYRMGGGLKPGGHPGTSLAQKALNRQMLFLFISNFSILSVGFGLFPLLPIYAGRFGATPTMIGIYLALTYISITIGSMMASWFSGRFSYKLALALAGVLGSVSLGLLGQATQFWHVIVLTGAVWFTGGVGLSIISVLIGLHTDKSNRGKWFSLVSLTNPLGAIIGGTAVGALVEWQGYAAMFSFMALEYSIWPVVGLLLVQEKQAPVAARVQTPGSDAVRHGTTLRLLLLAVLMASMTVSVNRLGISMLMKAHDYSAGDISTANVVGGIVTILVVLWLGALSDRLGRKLFLVIGYLLAAVGSLILVVGGELWHFWLVSATTLVARTISNSLASALAADVLQPSELGKSLPLIGSATWVAGVIGFAGSGVVMDVLGEASLFSIATAMALLSAGLIGTLPGKTTPRRLFAIRRMGKTVPQAANVDC